MMGNVREKQTMYNYYSYEKLRAAANGYELR